MKRSQFVLLLAAGLVGSCSRHIATRDRIRIALDADPTTLNLLLGDDPNTFDVGMVINSFLLRTNAHGDLIPALAAQVPTLDNGGISRDGRTLRYEIRPNARWHDGAPISAS